jgi:hypothetical protein
MDTKPPKASSLSSDEKIRSFRSVFRGREDVYAVRWQGRNGKSGYAPACAKMAFVASKSEWKANREFLPLTDTVVRYHLSGKLTAGVYPLLKDERCRFLAADFDKTTWQDDALAFQQTCNRAGSRHIWSDRDPAAERMCGYFSSKLLLPPSPESMVLPCSRGRWSDGIKLAWIPTTGFSRTRTHFRKAA